MTYRSPAVYILIFMLLSARPLHAAPAAKGSAKTTEKEPGTSVPSLGNHHINSIEEPHTPYNSKPPTSGDHVPMIARWGIYQSPIPNELQVHNLEDGGVAIQYDCTNCDDMIKKIESLAKDYSQKAQAEKQTGGRSRYEHLLVAPYPGMETPIALTAWGKIDKLAQFDEARIRRFVEAYIGIDHHPKNE